MKRRRPPTRNAGVPAGRKAGVPFATCCTPTNN